VFVEKKHFLLLKDLFKNDPLGLNLMRIVSAKKNTILGFRIVSRHAQGTP
jgi:hypothetical protein